MQAISRGALAIAEIVCLVLAFGGPIGANAEEDAGDALVGLVVGLLNDSDKDVRALGLDQVRTSAKGEAATRQFVAQLPKLSADAQVGLLRALADRGDAAARPAMLSMLADGQDEAVRVAAIGGLGALGEPADAQRLIALLGTAGKAEQAAARASLVRLRGESVAAAMASELKIAASPVRVTLIGILTSRRALDTVPAILAAAVDDDPLVRTAAMKSLGELADARHLAGMVQGVLVAEPGREREAAEKCVMFVCQRNGDIDERALPLLAAMDKLESSDRTILLSTLGRVGGSPAQKVVEAALADADATMHDSGLRALCNWPDASVADRLIELATTDDHPAHRISALRALIRVAPLGDSRSDEARLQLLAKAMTMCTRDAERNLVLDRARGVRTVESLRFLVPYMDQPPYAQQACYSIVELAHHRSLREPHKDEFHRALDKVIQTSKDATVVDRARRYQKGQTWVRPRAS